MATAEELLSGLKTVDKTFVISNDLRTISIPPTVSNLGVESDNDVLRLQFRMPRYIGDIDLSTFSIRINYVNASGESDVYTVRDPQATNDYISFSWLVGPTATRYKGETKFNVCLVTLNADGYVDHEFNTTVATMKVLEGLEVDESLVEEYSDLIEQWRRELFGIGDTEEASIRAASQAEQEAIENKGAEVLATIPPDYQTAVSMTDNAERTKADAIISSAKGETVQVSDSSNDYLRGLKIFGKTTQITTTGKNLVSPRNLYSNASRYEEVIFDGRNCIKMTSGKSVEFNGATFKPSTQYTVSCMCKTEDIEGNTATDIKPNCIFTFFYDDGTYTCLYANLAEYGWCTKTLTSSAGKTVSHIGIISYDYRTYTYIDVGTFQLEEGAVTTAYEPYSGGVASPNPNYPQELCSIGDSGSVAVNVTGKNLLNIREITASSSVVLNDDGSLTVKTGNYSISCLKEYTGLLPAGTYTFSNFAEVKTYIMFTRGDYTNTVKTGKTFTFTYDGHSYLRILFEDQEANTAITYKAQLELGSTATSYEPYQSQSLSISVPNGLPGIPVSEGGNYTDTNGQQWICDEVDFERGVYVQRFKSVIVSSWKLCSGFKIGTSEIFEADVKASGSSPNGYIAEARCNKFLNDSRISYTDKQAFSIGYNKIYARIPGVTDADEFNRVVGETKILYKLATPIETPLAAEEINTFRFIHSNFPNTTVFNDAGAMMELKYNADTKTWLGNHTYLVDRTTGVKYALYVENGNLKMEVAK